MKSRNQREMEKYWAEKARNSHPGKGSAQSAKKNTGRPATKSTQPPKSM